MKSGFLSDQYKYTSETNTIATALGQQESLLESRIDLKIELLVRQQFVKKGSAKFPTTINHLNRFQLKMEFNDNFVGIHSIKRGYGDLPLAKMTIKLNNSDFSVQKDERCGNQ